jgi:hypothetical protein
MADPVYGMRELNEGDVLGYLIANQRLNVLARAPGDVRVASVSLSAPPGSVARLGQWIIAGTATGQWAGHPANTIAIAMSENPTSALGWVFVTPQAGMIVWLIGATAGQELRIFNGTAWVTMRTYLGL